MSRLHRPVCTMMADSAVPVGCGEAREVVCSAGTDGVITTGAGFSTRYAAPSWQLDAIAQFWRQGDASKLPPPGWFNKQGRAIPDISTFGTNYAVLMGEEIQLIAGTSAAAPVMAAMVTLWNDLRAASGLPPLGFINPLLYQLAKSNPEAFNDVVVGDSKCLVRGITCCKYGFSAAPGYDPVSGLGSPRWSTIASLLLNPSQDYPYLAGALPESAEVKSSFRIAVAAAVVAVFAVLMTLVLFFRSRSSASINSDATSYSKF
jgi:hypothetical protein